VIRPQRIDQDEYDVEVVARSEALDVLDGSGRARRRLDSHREKDPDDEEQPGEDEVGLG
jgi:hypothetical protein